MLKWQFSQQNWWLLVWNQNLSNQEPFVPNNFQHCHCNLHLLYDLQGADWYSMGLNRLFRFKWRLCVSVFDPQTLPVQARLWVFSSAVGSRAGLPPDLRDSILPSTAAPPSQQRDQTTVYLQQASPLLQLEVYSPVRLPPHPDPRPAAHIRHRWVTELIGAGRSRMAAREAFALFVQILFKEWTFSKQIARGARKLGGLSRDCLINSKLNQ